MQRLWCEAGETARWLRARWFSTVRDSSFRGPGFLLWFPGTRYTRSAQEGKILTHITKSKLKTAAAESWWGQWLYPSCEQLCLSTCLETPVLWRTQLDGDWAQFYHQQATHRFSLTLGPDSECHLLPKQLRYRAQSSCFSGSYQLFRLFL